MKRIRDIGIEIGSFPQGARNLITDVPGVRVGHATLHEGSTHTGVTLILPVGDGDSLYYDKCIAASYVQNGFGKTCGLVQIDELGTLETPIALTNTLNVGKLSDCMITLVTEYEAKAGRKVYTCNPVVGECNDSIINDISLRAVGEKELREAWESASAEFALGAVGGGTGTICYDLKGGIGSASRIVEIGGASYTVGVLVQSNFGTLRDLMVDGRRIGREIEAKQQTEASPTDRGSIMMVLATDLPVSSRQLHRVLRRMPNGLARTGCYTGHGSGEIAIGFSTANRIGHTPVMQISVLQEKQLDTVFRAVGESVEEAVLDSLYTAGVCTALSGKTIHSLSEYL